MSGVSGASLFRDKLRERGLLSVRIAATPAPISDLELIPICGDDEPWISGEDLLMRTMEVGANLGQEQVEYILENRNDIPEEWGIPFLLFPDVIRRDRPGNLYFPFIYWNGEWGLEFCLLDSRHSSSGRLVRRRRRARK